MFLKIIGDDSEITKEVMRAIYELGEIFAVRKAGYYVSKINNILRKNPKNVLLRLIRQEIVFNSREYDEKDLLKINDKDLEFFPENPHFINFKGLIYLELDDPEKALKYIGQALDLEPENVDFIRNKAITYTFNKEFLEAHKVIQYALGLEPNYILLKETRDNIDRKEIEDNQEDELYEIKEKIDEQAKNIKNIKFEFIQIFAFFIVILTVVVKVISFDYENFRSVGFFDIILYQLAINSSWLFALILILTLIIILHVRRK